MSPLFCPLKSASVLPKILLGVDSVNVPYSLAFKMYLGATSSVKSIGVCAFQYLCKVVLSYTVVVPMFLLPHFEGHYVKMTFRSMFIHVLYWQINTSPLQVLFLENKCSNYPQITCMFITINNNYLTNK